VLPWIGIALLSASWLFGLEYYHAPEPAVWLVLIAGGTLLLAARPGRLPAHRLTLAALLLTLAGAMFWDSWRTPQQAAIVLLLAGLVSSMLPRLLRVRTPRKSASGRHTSFWRSLPFFGRWLSVGWASTVAQRLAVGAVLAGSILLVQSLGWELYAVFTSRSHELPAALAGLLGRMASVLGIDAGVHDTTVAVFSMREIHRLGATWELLFDPVTFCFVIGGIAALAWQLWSDGFPAGRPGRSQCELPLGPESTRDTSTRPVDDVGSRFRGFSRLGIFAGAIVLWLPCRAGLLMALFLHSVLRTEYEEMLNSVCWFWSGWLHLALLSIPVLAAWRLCSLRCQEGGMALQSRVSRSGQSTTDCTARESHATGHTARESRATENHGRSVCDLPSSAVRPGGWRLALAGGLVLAAAGTMTAAVLWDPVGPRKAGRVAFEEHHPDPEKVWERTDKPFDTEWYGPKSGYTFYCLYDYLGRFYDTSRLTQPIHDAALRDLDVLVLKTPTRPLYSQFEIECIRRYVQRGGGLLLIGEHTDVYGTSRCLNPVARLFGFQFVPDCLFGVDEVFEQRWRPSRAAHPSVQHVGMMDFATSCSLDVRGGFGRAAIRSTGLKNKTAEYHVENFYPVPSDSARMRYGAFVQLWSTRYGRGRVMAFTDSTDFSNFCVFDPGKAELALGMIEWLNHRPPAWDPRPWLAALALFLAAGGVWAAWGHGDMWLVFLAASVLGYAAAAGAAAAAHRAALPLPQPQPDRPLVRVVMDRTISAARLPTNGFIDGRPHGFGIFERWVLRLGYFTARRQAPATFAQDVDVLVIAYPRAPISKSYRKQLTDYVSRGGKLLVIDSARNAKAAAEDSSDTSPPDTRHGGPGSRQLRDTSTANDLLEPFQMSVDHATELQGPIESSHASAPVPTMAAAAVHGGRPFAWIEGRPVGAWQTYAAGTVVVVGYGDRLCDQQMGVTGDIEPDAEMRQVYDLEFALLRAVVEGRLGERRQLAAPPERGGESD
jgi:hypothetical protein